MSDLSFFVASEQEINTIPEHLKVDLDLSKFQMIEFIPENNNYLLWADKKLSLNTLSKKNIQIEFNSTKYNRIFKPTTDLLCKACGWSLGYRNVWDLTAGFGVDAITLTRAGFWVQSHERNPLLAILLRHSLREHQSVSDTLKNLSFIFADSSQLFIKVGLGEMGNVSNNFSLVSDTVVPDVIYYDPMYPPSKKSALPSKEMQILREINGTDDESRELIEKFIQLAEVKRVVVKRPHRALPLIEKPKFQITGKLLRFDVYT